MTMAWRSPMIFTLLSIITLTTSAEPVTTLPMSVITRNHKAYLSFLAEKGKSPLEIDNLESVHSNRNIAMMILIQQALALGGLPVRLKLIDAPNYAREIQMTRNGRCVIMHQDAWDVSFDHLVYKSSEVIPRGRFVKGFYVAEGDRRMYKVRTLTDLQLFTSVSNPLWDVDWKTLEKMNLKALYETPKKEFMFNQVLRRGVHFTMQEFGNNSDLSYETPAGRLIPIPGIMIALDGARHLMISKQHPLGQPVLQALERGLTVLRREGRILRFLHECGFYRKEVKDWKTLRVDRPTIQTTPQR